MAPSYTPDPDPPGPAHEASDPSQHKSHLMRIADQVDRADGGSSFPRILHSPIGALVVFLLLMAVVVFIGFPLWVAR
ncbi:MAG TPA: hypothetical protein VJ976_02065 [Ornithinimicrobium sp.]|uniref:hypothetical protein n=1 Tax=Ornithinimicrobium sp. TaxID=1977084 RepID=UPI002B46EEF0|nr:hypothetical protein [Ornithinimicrobium sp.]HKJ11154.1 hypothetical protein [Ornithinimicrobium sp.]